MPRDILTVVEMKLLKLLWMEIKIFEYRPYRKLIKEYFHSGAKWTSAPKPEMSDDLYNKDWNKNSKEFESVVTEYEPVFDAAEFKGWVKIFFVNNLRLLINLE